jgi:hypothetical protein
MKVRDVKLNNVTFITSYEKNSPEYGEEKLRAPELDRASFGFLHDWAVKAGNAEVAHLARGTELAIERRTANGRVERYILSMWSLFANFGLSPMRPFLWMLTAMFVMWSTLYCTGSSVALPKDHLVGWRSILLDSGEYSGASRRAVAGVLEGTVSPLSVLSPRRMIVPDKTWVAGLQVLYGYFCLAMVLLIGFAIRRRFKIS